MDVGLWSHLLSTPETEDILIYEIDIADISSERLVSHQLTDGQRDRVVAMARGLSECDEDLGSRVVCFADRDWDDVLALKHDGCAYLVLTEYTAIEMHAFCGDVLDKFLRVVLRIPSPSGERICEALETALRELFLLRAGSISLSWNLHWVDPIKCMAKTESGITFSRDEYIFRYLNTRGRTGSTEEFRREVERLRALTATERRLAIRGHDFTAMLAWFLDAPEWRRMGNREMLASALMASIDTDAWRATEDYANVLKGFGRVGNASSSDSTPA
jgi:hypothetical protein